jgi:peptidoglycan hydrolase CwlO-like protein
MRTALRLSVFVLLLICLSGCDTADSQRPASQQDTKQQKLADLNRQKADALYEIQLRQDEMKEMEATAKRPGVGVSKEWLERHNQLKEEIIKLKVKIHDLELQIDDLAKP